MADNNAPITLANAAVELATNLAEAAAMRLLGHPVQQAGAGFAVNQEAARDLAAYRRHVADLA